MTKSVELGAQSLEQKLPLHGFVLAGGKSSRMGVDKATLEFRGRPMVEIAVEKLRGFCQDVSICGSRDDLSLYAPVVHDVRVDCGPAAGIEAGLLAARQEWCLFVPVDVPLVPGELLRQWADGILSCGLQGLGSSYLIALDRIQPAFCMIRRDCVAKVSAAMSAGRRGLGDVLSFVDDYDGESWSRAESASKFLAEKRPLDCVRWFANLNTPMEFDETEMWADIVGD